VPATQPGASGSRTDGRPPRVVYGTASEPIRGRVSLQRVLSEPDLDALGSAQFRTKGDVQSFALDVQKLDAPPGASYSALLEDAAGSGAFASIGDLLLVQPTKGRWTLLLEETGAPPASLGVSTLAELEGRRIEVRDGAGTAYLWAVLPGPAPGANLKLSGALAAPGGAPLPGASASIKLQYKASKGSSRFDLKAKGLAEGPDYTVWIEEGSTEGNFGAVGLLIGGKLLRDTKKGGPLPLGVSKVSDLAGRAIEIREGSTVVLAGSLPSPPPPPPTALVYFDSNRDGQEEIYVRGLSGSSSDRLTNASGTDDFAPAVSADGEWIAFSRSPVFVGVPTDLWKMRTDGTGLVQLTDNGADENQFPSFSPDGTKIV
ncbi:MAG TPA: hypothetical protein VKF62_02855, partial [Planctomycetota bacterium]|nr:hypothetical protein [Planctomycetota bacterium]